MVKIIVDKVLEPSLESDSAVAAPVRSLSAVESTPAAQLDVSYADYSPESMTEADRAFAA